MKCKNCPYCYKTKEDRFPCCHYPDDGTLAPCEDDDPIEEEDRYTFADLGNNWW